MIRPVALLPLVLLAGFARAQVQPPASPQERPTTKVLDCTTSGCHAPVINHTFLHGPTAVSACDACHEYQDPARHAFQLKRPGRQLCDFCHIDKTGTEGPIVHEPFAKGNCTGCHDPHGSETRRMLKSANITQLCTSCHKDVLNGTQVHKPAGENCADCHSPHSAAHDKLLVKDRRDLCLSCHEKVGQAVDASPHPHKPVQGDCTQCHTPHASNEPKILKAALKDLCVSCHKDVGTAISTATHQHDAVTDAKACLNCHTAHASDHVKLLAKDPVSACLECHAKPITIKGRPTVASVAEVTYPEMHKHGPIDKGDCAACHTVHGGALPNLLVEAYDDSFYQKYSDTAYPLCFKCHERTLVTSTTAEKETGFRDGARNLHSVHVNKTADGRSCRACHTIHAGKTEPLLAESVSFGQWKLPINYKKTQTGGSCAPGCHKPASYDRVTPIGRAPAPPLGAPPEKPKTETPATPTPPVAPK